MTRSRGLPAATGTTGNITVNVNGGTLAIGNYVVGGVAVQSAPTVLAWNYGTGSSAVNLGDGEIVSSAASDVDAESIGGTVSVTEGKNTKLTASAGTATTNFLGVAGTGGAILSGAGIQGASAQSFQRRHHRQYRHRQWRRHDRDRRQYRRHRRDQLWRRQGRRCRHPWRQQQHHHQFRRHRRRRGRARRPKHRRAQLPGQRQCQHQPGQQRRHRHQSRRRQGRQVRLQFRSFRRDQWRQHQYRLDRHGRRDSITGPSNIPTTGISASTAGTGAINITTGTGTTITSGNGPAIYASAGSGAVSIVNNGILTGNLAGSPLAIATAGGSSIGIVNNGTINGAVAIIANTSLPQRGHRQHRQQWHLEPDRSEQRHPGQERHHQQRRHPGGLGHRRHHGPDQFQQHRPDRPAQRQRRPRRQAHHRRPLCRRRQAQCRCGAGHHRLGLDLRALADCLTVSAPSGVTGVVVNDSATLAQAGLNSGGVLIVNGASAAGQFVIDPSSPNYDAATGTVDEGLFGYGLSYGSNQVRLVSGPSAVALQIPALIGAIQGSFYSSNPVSTRLTWLRDASYPQGGSYLSTGVWVDFQPHPGQQQQHCHPDHRRRPGRHQRGL